MDADTCDEATSNLMPYGKGPFDNYLFLCEYLRLASHDLVVG